MLLKRLRLFNVRNYAHLELSPAQGINLFCGLNGQGKTNLLEAIYLVCKFKSFRTHDLGHLLGPAAKLFQIHGLLWDGSLDHDLVIEWERGKKKVLYDKKILKTQKKLRKENFCMFFSNKDMYFVHDAPRARRLFFDQLLCTLSRHYHVTLKKYQQSLRQRSALLKQGQPFDQYDEVICKEGLTITNARRNFLEAIKVPFQSIFSHLLREKELRGDLQYTPIKGQEALHRPMSMEFYADALKASAKKDKQIQRTSFGPHQGDFTFYLNHFPLRDFGSQGQIKLFIFALKLAITRYYEKILKRFPTLLLDDVFADLDEERIGYFMTFLNRATQVFMTCPNLNLLQGNRLAMTVYKIHQGNLLRL